MDAELKQYLEALEQRVDQKLLAMEQRINARIEKTEITLRDPRAKTRAAVMRMMDIEFDGPSKAQ